MTNLDEDFTLPNKAMNALGRWQAVKLDFDGYESYVLSKQKQFKKYRLNTYILNHYALRIQHILFGKIQTVTEKRNQEFKEQMKKQQQQRIDIFKTKKRTQVSSHSGLGVLNFKQHQEQSQSPTKTLETAPQTMEYVKQTPSEAYSSPRFQPDNNAQIITNSYQIFDVAPSDSHTNTTKNSGSRSLIDQIVNKNVKTPSAAASKSYKNVGSRLHTPTKSALGKYGSRFTNDNESTSLTANVSPISTNNMKPIAQAQSTTKLIQSKNQISIVDKKQDQTVISSTKPLAQKQSQCKNTIIQYKSDSKQISSVRAQVTLSNISSTQKQKADPSISSKTKLVQAKHVIDRKTIDKTHNNTTNTTINNTSSNKKPTQNQANSNQKSYQQKLQDTYSSKSPIKSIYNSKSGDLVKSPVKQYGINANTTQPLKQSRDKVKPLANQVNYSQGHTRQGSINNDKVFAPSIKHASPVSSKYDKYFKNLERPKSLVDLKRRAAPLIEVLKLNDVSSSQESHRDIQNKESVHKIVYKFKDIIY
ncbi:UNKNOWN [Stylonychia lemnae]|uniref:Uncharacterized protein n=1 Tax=Stylonychia lemnae TaxID=5949 RepID=A0A078A8B6_STYLE|nr:UNKNOWN [Stylonychia lemnae]|eukprot:CDW78111.1 UNKNOWN [Stylonychia lemnae]